MGSGKQGKDQHQQHNNALPRHGHGGVQNLPRNHNKHKSENRKTDNAKFSQQPDGRAVNNHWLRKPFGAVVEEHAEATAKKRGLPPQLESLAKGCPALNMATAL